MRIVNEFSAGGVGEHLTARMFSGAFTHCALARIPVLAPQHSFVVQTS